MNIDVKRIILSVIIILFVKPCAFLLRIFARLQMSIFPLRILSYIPFQVLDLLFRKWAVRILFFSSQPKEKKRRSPYIKNTKVRAFLYLAIANKSRGLVPPFTDKEFVDLFMAEKLRVDYYVDFAHKLFAAGNLSYACLIFKKICENKNLFSKLDIAARIELVRHTANSFFMAGDIKTASEYWAKVGKLRKSILCEGDGPVYRCLGSTWYAAIGHVAMLDTYLKFHKMYHKENSRIVAPIVISSTFGDYLCKRFQPHGIEFVDIEYAQVNRSLKLQYTNYEVWDNIKDDYDQWATEYGRPSWSVQTIAEIRAKMDEFWEYDFPDGTLGYAHGACRIQKEWEDQGNAPLLSLSSQEKVFAREILSDLGMPKDAWYVCLHVREPGFYKQWNSKYPSMRDANIDDYHLAIKEITDAGGWVVRMGDKSMRKLPDEMPNVIDYAHEPMKSPKSDILIAAGCKFFIGTNSGFALIASAFGVQCVYTNWLPIGLPAWFPQDLMIHKLFWHKVENRYLTISEIFKNKLAYLQNRADLPENIELHDNTPNEIVVLVQEALSGEENADYSVVQARIAYKQIAESNGAYVGSKIGASFIKKRMPIYK